MTPGSTLTSDPSAASAADSAPRSFRAAMVSPAFAHEADWPWLSGVPPLDASGFQRHRIRNVFAPLPKATGPYRWLQYRRTAQAIRDREIAFLFSTDIVEAMTSRLASTRRRPRLVYVGFTQDGHWDARRIEAMGRALRRCDAVTTFTEEERRIYLERYAVDPARLHVVPIHTDDAAGYARYHESEPPQAGPYVVSMGVMNRRFGPVARACRAHGIPLVILTRPHHANDDLDELGALGATIVTDANQPQAWTWLRHARLAVLDFDDPTLPGGFTTLMNAMFLGTPLLVSDCIGMREHVIEHETGGVVPHGDEAALTAALERMWFEPGLADRFGAASLRRADRCHSLHAAAAAHHRVALATLDGDPVEPA